MRHENLERTSPCCRNYGLLCHSPTRRKDIFSFGSGPVFPNFEQDGIRLDNGFQPLECRWIDNFRVFGHRGGRKKRMIG